MGYRRRRPFRQACAMCRSSVAEKSRCCRTRHNNISIRFNNNGLLSRLGVAPAIIIIVFSNKIIIRTYTVQYTYTRVGRVSTYTRTRLFSLRIPFRIFTLPVCECVYIIIIIVTIRVFVFEFLFFLLLPIHDSKSRECASMRTTSRVIWARAERFHAPGLPVSEIRVYS